MKYYEIYLQNKVFSTLFEYEEIFDVFVVKDKQSKNYDYLSMICYSMEYLRKFENIINNYDLYDMPIEDAKDLHKKLFDLRNNIIYRFPTLIKFNIFEIMEGFSQIYLSQKTESLKDEVKPNKVFKVTIKKIVFSDRLSELFIKRFQKIIKTIRKELYDLNVSCEYSDQNKEYIISICFYIDSNKNKLWLDSIKGIYQELECDDLKIIQLDIADYYLNHRKKKGYSILTNI